MERSAIRESRVSLRYTRTRSRYVPLTARLLNYPVGAREQRRRDRDAERIRSLQVDQQLKTFGGLHRQVGGFGAAQDAVDVIGGAQDGVAAVDTVGDQRAGVRMGLEGEDRRHALRQREVDDQVAIDLADRVRQRD